MTTENGDTDLDLLRAFAKGDRSAARSLAERLLPRVYGQAMRMLANRAEAEDVAQDAMLKLWKAAPGWEDRGAKISTWLYAVTGNLCRDRLRARRPQVSLDHAPEPFDPAPEAAAEMIAAERARALSDAIGALPDRQAQAISLRHLEELSNPEIAQIMDITVEAVESLLARGKRALSTSLKAQSGKLGFMS